MRNSTCLVAACFFAASLFAYAQEPPEAQPGPWLQQGGHWLRTDRYGMDRNKNGRIDRDEWTIVRTQGDDRVASPWNKARPERPGEVHRYNVLWDEDGTASTTEGARR